MLWNTGEIEWVESVSSATPDPLTLRVYPGQQHSKQTAPMKNNAPENGAPEKGTPEFRVAIIGGGPAGLMAAEQIARAGAAVELFDAMPSVGRKLLRAGIGGLNLTHAEASDTLVTRYGKRQTEIAALLARFGRDELLQWVHELGIETFTGSSQRIFPVGKKAAPLLRLWLHRLRGLGVKMHVRHRWLGWDADGELIFQTQNGQLLHRADATVLALGGASWPQLGSDGAWVSLLQQKHICIAPLQASNCGFVVPWSEHFREKFARQPVKAVAATVDDAHGESHTRNGELMVTDSGLEGGLLYALSAPARDTLEQNGSVTLQLDLCPDRTLPQLEQRLAQPQGSRSLAKHLKDKAGIDGVKAGLLREFASAQALHDPQQLAQALKSLPVPLQATQPIAKAISSAGGVGFDELNPQLMLNRLPGVFCAGEMLDWEAPTGGYLLTACFASGFVAGKGVVQWLASVSSATDRPATAPPSDR